LLSEAIADAKAVKETALANAKLALEEAFTPKLQSMISAKLAEEADEDEMEDEKEDDTAVAVEAEMDSEVPTDGEEVTEEEGEEEHKVKTEEEGEEAMADEPTDTDETYEEGEEAMADEPTDTDETYEGEEESEEDDLDLASVIKELEAELDSEEDDKPTDEMYEEEDEEKSIEDGMKSEEEDMEADGDDSEESNDDEIDLDEVIKTLKEMEDDSEKSDDDDTIKEEEEDSKKDDELEEAYLTIESLQKTINEENLLNAKLLYTNKLFRTFDLNEGQKVKVLENFDRTSSVREVKLVFSTLAENLNVAKKKRTVVKEGYASKATKSSAPKKIISEGNDMAARWKKLAGLK
jgi:hypothetical protein